MSTFLFATVVSTSGDVSTGSLSFNGMDGAVNVQHVSTPAGGDPALTWIEVEFDRDITDAAVNVNGESLVAWVGSVAMAVEGDSVLVGLSSGVLSRLHLAVRL